MNWKTATQVFQIWFAANELSVTGTMRPKVSVALAEIFLLRLELPNPATISSQHLCITPISLQLPRSRETSAIPAPREHAIESQRAKDDGLVCSYLTLKHGQWLMCSTSEQWLLHYKQSAKFIIVVSGLIIAASCYKILKEYRLSEVDVLRSLI